MGGAVKFELSRLFSVAEQGEKAANRDNNVDITASAPERAALAARFDLLSVDRFEARLALKLDPVGNLALKGRIEAAVVQRCVATLDPVSARLGEDFEVIFAKEDTEPVAGEALDLPEPWPGDVLDVGEIAVQQLGLALDPYPKSAAVKALENGASGDQDAQEGPEGTHRPFSNLAKLRDSLAGKA